MKRVVYQVVLSFALLILSTSVFALNGDAARGKTLTATCAACHGADGNSINPEWPSLAGQNTNYLVQQINYFKQGKRQNALMNNMVNKLSAQDIADVAAYFSEQKIKTGTAQNKDLVLGTQLYRGGDIKRGISACSACHGPSGLGNADAGFPKVAGLGAQYVVNQLNNYKDAKRPAGLNNMMPMIAKKLSKQDKTAVANFIQGLH